MKKVKFIAGIDEAGRGPVIGDLVISLVSLREDQLNLLEDLEKKHSFIIQDSKKLNKTSRDKIFKEIKNLSETLENEVFIINSIITPKEIEEKNLNELEAEKMSSLIKKLIEKLLKIYGENLEIDIFIDLPERLNTFLKRMKKYIDFNYYNKKGLKIKLNLEHKSDEKYKIVSLASIVAKHLRDSRLEEIKKELSDLGDIGSAYPSDPLTKSFLKKYYKNKRVLKYVRRKWKSYLNLLDEKERLELEKKFFPEKFKKKNNKKIGRNKNIKEFLNIPS